MLRKLLKYDLRASLRIFAIGWLAVVLLTAVQCLLLSFDMENPLVSIVVVLSAIPYVLGIIAMFSVPNIYFGVRFYRGLLGREGYLMFTLPTQPWKLLASKLLSAMIITTVTFLVSVTALLTWISCLLYSTEGIRLFGDLFMFMGWEPKYLWNILGLLLTMLCTFACNNLLLYLACCLGHLFRTRRVLWTVVMYLALNTAMSTVSGLGRGLQTLNMETDATFTAITSYFSVTVLPLSLGVAVLCFFFCERILHNKLNLE